METLGSQSTFWCHGCSRRIRIVTVQTTPFPLCPNCNSGFLEQLQTLSHAPRSTRPFNPVTLLRNDVVSPETNDANSYYTRAVDNAIRSATPSISGDSPVRSFGSRIDSAIRSSTASSTDSLGLSGLENFEITPAPFQQAQVQHDRVASSPPPPPNTVNLQQSLLQTEERLNGVTPPLWRLNTGNLKHIFFTSKKRKFIKLKAHFFQQNGGLLLQQMAKYNGSSKMTEVFTIEELKQATNNFNKDMIISQGGQRTVYKGIFPDNKTVAIKKSRINNSNQVDHFINEVIILSQINHRNVVKLLGCCLETEVPLLVYEFIPNGTVYEHLHDQRISLRLTWKTRLRIATETAQALAYLHSATSTPIIHRDVKTAHILLDDNLVAKVVDFGASRPLDQIQGTTFVQGTLGYLDPEYFRTSQLTEKSDVYSFGVVLIEIVTGKKALCFDGPEEHRNLAMCFDSSMKEGQLVNIVDRHIIDEASIEQLMKVANIASHCLRLKREERPTMREVAMQLEGICGVDKHQWENTNLSSAETEEVLDPTPYGVHIVGGDGGRGNTSSRFDYSNQISMSLNNGR